jgi:uncharacterized protein
MKSSATDSEHRPGQIFNEEHVLHTLKHYLPSQGPLKDFVHHNSLHAFQEMSFYDAIFKASKIFGYKVTFSLAEYRNLYQIGRIHPAVLERVIRERKGAEHFNEWHQKVMQKTYDGKLDARIRKLRYGWREHYPIDLNNAVHPLLFRILNSYLDQGIAITPFPFENTGLLNAIRTLDKNSLVHFFKTERARTLLHDAHLSLETLLTILVGKKEYFEEYIYGQQFAHRGWSGMVSTLEDHPEALLYPKKIEFKDLILLECLMEIDALDGALGTEWKPLGEITDRAPMDIFADIEAKEIYEVIKIWHDAFEWSYYDEALSAVLNIAAQSPKKKEGDKLFQAVFCIDEREGSIRRHIESVSECETLGAPGFFGVEFYFHPAHAKFYDKLCPAPVTPTFLIQEISSTQKHAPAREIAYSKESHTFLRGTVASYVLGIPSLIKLLSNLISPRMSPAIADAFSHMHDGYELTIQHEGKHDEKRNLQIGFTVNQMADRIEKLLRGIGLVKDFSRLVYLIGHGSSSANNPHHGAHDCGACSGRPGSVNARVAASMANFPAVREELTKRGLIIPASTHFVGGLHDTASDEIEFYDEKKLPADLQDLHAQNKKSFEHALDLNAKERSRRFKSIDTKQSLKKIRKAIKQRSVSYFEPRPELGHGTNALCIVGERALTRNLFLDRRAFMNSYDYRTDLDGTFLANVIAPLPVVCGGINLEYYFSRMDNSKLGAGTKLPHNVMGLIGVSNSSDGDLRAGLPLQMVEVHDPIRLLMIVEHDPQVVLRVISASPALYEWFVGEWIHLVVLHPEEKKLYLFKKGAFVPYEPGITGVSVLNENFLTVIESAIKMKTNDITDATKENMPVHILSH